MRSYMPLQLFKSAVAKNQRPAGLLSKTTTVQVLGLDDRRSLFTISTASIDRDRDRVIQEGWDLQAYLSNPVVLWGHNSDFLPIGKTVKVGVEDGALKAIVEYVPADMPEVGPLAEAVHRMCATGFLSASSVGFRPTQYTLAKDRMEEDEWFPPLDFEKSELLEWSIVSIPANAEALIDSGDRQPSADQAAAVEAEAEKAARLVSIRTARHAARLAAYS